MSTLSRTTKFLALTALAAAAFSFDPAPASAACNSGWSGAKCSDSKEISLTAYVPANCTVGIVPITTDINLTATPAQPIKVATVTEKCNAKGGYKITVSSTNSAKFKGTAGNDVDLAYTLAYGSHLTLENAASATSLDALPRTTGTGIARDVTVTYSGAELPEDMYSDTVTITLAGQ